VRARPSSTTFVTGSAKRGRASGRPPLRSGAGGKRPGRGSCHETGPRGDGNAGWAEPPRKTVHGTARRRAGCRRSRGMARREGPAADGERSGRRTPDPREDQKRGGRTGLRTRERAPRRPPARSGEAPGMSRNPLGGGRGTADEGEPQTRPEPIEGRPRPERLGAGRADDRSLPQIAGVAQDA